jgi:hypothetical protein
VNDDTRRLDAYREAAAIGNLIDQRTVVVVHGENPGGFAPSANARVRRSSSARDIFPEPGRALWHAISAYNTGSLYAGKAYVDRVVAAATRETRVPSIALLAGDRIDRSAAVAVRASSKTIRRIVRKVRLNDFAFAKPNSMNLVITSSSLRHIKDSFAR